MTDATTQVAAPAIGGDSAKLSIGYVPLTDAAPLLVAVHKGMFARHGVRVLLSRAAAWSAVRDRLLFGALDGAQVLAPMPLAGGGLGVVATLGLNGNTITFGESLLRDIRLAAPEQAELYPLPISAMAAALALRRACGRRPPVIAVVFPFSSHNYLLRYWLATGGIDADRDVRLIVVPPPLVAEYLAEGVIDGFCAGEPWGSRAVDLRAGRIALASADIWRNHPEKVLAFSTARLAGDPGPIVACLGALIEAGSWLDAPENQDEAAALLCAHALDGVPPELVLAGLRGRLQLAPDTAPAAIAPPIFHRHAAGFPFRSHEAWWLGQMRRWGHAPPQPPGGVWRSDLWRAAAARLAEAEPLADSKTEGGHTGAWQLAARSGVIAMAPDPFIDGASFADAAGCS